MGSVGRPPVSSTDGKRASEGSYKMHIKCLL
jgi:hypothetical protein